MNSEFISLIVLSVAKLQTSFGYYPIWGLFWDTMTRLWNHVTKGGKSGGSKKICF